MEIFRNNYIEKLNKQFKEEKPFSVENGYFIFTLMPSLNVVSIVHIATYLLSKEEQVPLWRLKT